MLAAGVWAQTPPVTPNVGLYLPPHGSYNWDTWYNSNWSLLDGLLSGSSSSVLNYVPPFTGAVSRRQNGKLGDVVSVKDFGAVGDGVTDDSTAIQNAINYALARSNVNGVIGGAVYFPTAQYLIKKTINITKSMPGGITLYGDGPHATNVTAATTFVGTAGFNINSNGGAMVFRDMAVDGPFGGIPNVDGIYVTGNGIFFENLWLAGWGGPSNSGAGLHLYLATNMVLNGVLAEHNNTGIWFDTCIGDSISNSQTYQNIAGGIYLTGQIPLSLIGGTGGQPPANEISNMDLMEDTTGGGGAAAIYVSTNAPVLISNTSVASNNNGRPGAGLFMDAGTDRVEVSNFNVGHTMNYGIYAVAGWLSVTGGTFDRIGSYSTIAVPTGGYSSTTQSAAIFAGSSVSSLSVTGSRIRNTAGFGILSSATYTTIANNLIDNFGIGNLSGGQQNSTTGMTAISLIPSQNFAQFTVIGNTVASSAPAPLTAVSLVPAAGVTLAAHAIRAVQNSILSGFGTQFTTTLTTPQLLSQDVDVDNTTRLAGGAAIVSGFAASLQLTDNTLGGNPSFHITDALTGNFHDFGFVYQPGSYAQIYTVQQGVGNGEPLELEPGAGQGRVLIGTSTDNGADKLQVNGTLNLAPIKALSGTRFLCINTSGQVVSQTTACSGT